MWKEEEFFVNNRKHTSTYITPIFLKFANSAGRKALSLLPLKVLEFTIQ